MTDPQSLSEILQAFGLVETFTLPDGTRLVNIHSRLRCEGRSCVIHNPSDHHMREFPLIWRDDRRVFERVCPHGIKHPDPDDFRFHLSLPSGDDGWGVHACDDCCVE